jgi:hypothetical protein
MARRPGLRLVSEQSANALKLRRELRAWIEKLEPSVRKGFEDSVNNLKSEVLLQRAVDSLRDRDTEGALRSLNIEEEAFAPLRLSLEGAYRAGGDATAKNMPRLKDRTGGAVIIRFNVANPRAEREIANMAGTEITRISNDTMLAARAVVLDGYAKGLGPKTIALDLAGRINPATGRREGGVLGMSSPQTEAALSLRTRLLSGDPAEMRKVFDMKLRDKRFDASLRKLIAAGKAPSPADVTRMYGRYVDNAIQLRGEMVARTETGRAVHAASLETFRQGLEKAGYTAAAVTRTWRSAGDKRVRHSHEEMNGQTVTGLDQPFVSPNGSRLMFPLDSSLGASLDEIINCRCDQELDIDFSEGLE